MCDTPISIFKSISISRQPLFRLRDRYQYWKSLITNSRPISIFKSWHYELDTDINTWNLAFRSWYQYRYRIGAITISRSISITISIYYGSDSPTFPLSKYSLVLLIVSLLEVNLCFCLLVQREGETFLISFWKIFFKKILKYWIFHLMLLKHVSTTENAEH